MPTTAAKDLSALLKSAKQRASVRTVKSVQQLTFIVRSHSERSHPELYQQALDVYLFHVRETPIPPLSPANSTRSPSPEEEICACCVSQVAHWAIKNDENTSAANPARIALDRLWQWTEYFVDAFVSDVYNQAWDHSCYNTIMACLGMISVNHLVTLRGAEIVLGFWLALGKKSALRSKVNNIIMTNSTRDTFSLVMGFGSLIAFCSSNDPALAERNQLIRRLLEAAESHIVEVVFRQVATYRLDAAASHGQRAWVWADLSEDLYLIAVLLFPGECCCFVDRAQIFSATPARSIMRILSWLTDKSPSHWKTTSSEVLSQLSQSVQHCLVYMETLFLEPLADSKFPLLIHDGLPAALTRAHLWFREEISGGSRDSIEEQLETMKRGILKYMWSWPVYAALDAQYSARPNDMDPRIVARLHRWAPAKALFQHHAGGAVVPLLCESASCTTECSYSQCIRGNPPGQPRRKRLGCSGCRSAFYCDHICQSGAWKTSGDDHRLQCLPLMARIRSDLHPKSLDAMEFMRGIAEQELALYDQSRFRKFQRGVLFLGQIFKIELELEDESKPKIFIGSFDEGDHAPSTKELWADVFAEAAHDGYMLVRLAFSKMQTAERCTAFCSVRKPNWVQLEVE